MDLCTEIRKTYFVMVRVIHRRTQLSVLFFSHILQGVFFSVMFRHENTRYKLPHERESMVNVEHLFAVYLVYFWKLTNIL